MTSFHAIGGCLLVLAASLAAHGQAPTFGQFESQIEGVGEARSIAIDPDGQVFVGPRNEEVADGYLVFDGEGTIARTSDDGSVVLLNESGEVIDRLAPTASVLALDLSGTRLAMVDESGRVAVHVRGPDGSLQADPQFEVAGFHGARGVVLDGEGGVWIADTDRHRLVHLGSEGEEILAFGARGAFPGLFNSPIGLDLHEGDLFVADMLNHRVVVHDADDGEFKYQWGMHAVVPREGEGKIHYPEDVAVAPDGSFVAVLEPFERRYQRFLPLADGGDPSGSLPRKLAVESHFGPQLGVDGELLVMHEPESNAAMVFDLRKGMPIHVTTFGRPGSGGSQFGRVASIAVDSDQQEIWFLDAGNRRISAWRLNRDPDGRLRQDPFMARFVRSIELDAIAEEADGFVPRQLFLRDGVIDLLSADGSGVLTLGRDLSIRGRTDFAPHAEGRIRWMAADPGGGWAGIAHRPAGEGPGRVNAIRVSEDGQVTNLKIIGEGGAANPVAIVPLESGEYLVSDRAGDCLSILGLNSIPREIGESGSWDGAMWLPGEAYRYPGGRVVVVDQGNHRAQVFDPVTGEWSLTFSLGMGHDKPMFLKEDFVNPEEQVQ